MRSKLKRWRSRWDEGLSPGCASRQCFLSISRYVTEFMGAFRAASRPGRSRSNSLRCRPSSAARWPHQRGAGERRQGAYAFSAAPSPQARPQNGPRPPSERVAGVAFTSSAKAALAWLGRASRSASKQPPPRRRGRGRSFLRDHHGDGEDCCCSDDEPGGRRGCSCCLVCFCCPFLPPSRR